MENVPVAALREHFGENPHHRQTICCTIKELLANNNPNGQSYLRNDIVNYLNAVLYAFDETLEAAQAQSEARYQGENYNYNQFNEDAALRSYGGNNRDMFGVGSG